MAPGRRVLVILLAAGLSGCAQAFVYGGGDDVRIHHARFLAQTRQGNTVTVCDAYTCKMQTANTFSQKDLAEIRAVIAKTEQADTPYEERRAVAYRHRLYRREGGQRAAASMTRPACSSGLIPAYPTQEYRVDVPTNTTRSCRCTQVNGMLNVPLVVGTMSKANSARG